MFARKRVALGVWLQMLVAIMGLYSAGEEKLFLLVSGDRYIVTGRGCPGQTRHSDFEVQEAWS